MSKKFPMYFNIDHINVMKNIHDYISTMAIFWDLFERCSQSVPKTF